MKEIPNGKLMVIYSLPSCFPKGFEAKCNNGRISGGMDGRGQSCPGVDFSGQRKWGVGWGWECWGEAEVVGGACCQITGD